MDKKCKICGNNFNATTEEKQYCSNICFMEYINSEDFDIEMEKMLGINSEECLRQKLRQAFEKVSIYSAQIQEVSAIYMDKFGYPAYNELINTITNKNEEGDNF